MGIDTSKYEQAEGCQYIPLREWEINGHAVAWMRCQYPNNPSNTSFENLYCECDFTGWQKTERGILHTIDSEKCPQKNAVRQLVIEESRQKYGEDWQKMGLRAAILDIFQKVESGEWLGQCDPDVIFVQEVTELLSGLGIENTHVLQACGDLEEMGKLSLEGMILTNWQDPKNIFANINPNSITDTKSALEALIQRKNFRVIRTRAGWRLIKFVTAGDRDRHYKIGEVQQSIRVPAYRPVVLAEAPTLIELAQKVIGG